MDTMREGKAAGAGIMASLAVLVGFFVMGFVDIIGAVMPHVQKDLALTDGEAGFLPSMIFVWFFVVSIPTGMLTTRIGRRNTVLASLAVTAAGLLLFVFCYVKVAVFAAFALLGIGNTMIQAALPALMKNIVPDDQLTSRLSLGQFVKALCAAVTPLLAGFAAMRLGNWKLIFPIYAGITVLVAAVLLFAPIPREPPAAGPATTFGGCLGLLGDPYILMMFFGIFLCVGADVGLACAIPPYLQEVCHIDLDKASMGPTVYFVAKTVGSFLGAVILAKVAAARFFPLTCLLAIAGTAAMLFTSTPVAFLACVAVASLGLSNIFGVVFGLAMNRRPEKANEISGLMVMAIAGGAAVTPLVNLAKGSLGAVNGPVAVLFACFALLLALAIWARRGAARA